MPSDPVPALVALHRFGLGARPGDWVHVAADPRGFVRQQLRPAAALLDGPALQSGDAAYRANRAAERQRDKDRAAKTPARPGPQPPAIEDKLFRAEIAARFNRTATVEGGLLERLVLFWSNHFAVSIAKGNHLKVLTGPYEREAIRPHVLGRFADMLRAVETHPAMLFYLDNNQSIGPQSRNGLTSHRGLNENLAREILELHTLGVGGGYSQADVTRLARVLTGWTVIWPDDDAIYGGHFTFAVSHHEPGSQTVLGRAYPQEDAGQGLAVLDDLARHPATARHIARKLAAHFVADNPPPALVDDLAGVFTRNDGDLAAVTRALLDSPIAWQAPLTKMRAPQEFLIAGMRIMGAVSDPPAVLDMLNNLGQPLWRPPGPNGFGDAGGDWISPRGLAARLDIAAAWGRRNDLVDPLGLMEAVLGPAVSVDTRAAVAGAESRRQGLAILLMAPELQRR